MTRSSTMRAAVVLAGLASAATPALAKDIQLGAILPLTGPGAVVGTQEERGIQFATDQINAKGGIDGHKIVVQFEDNQAKPDQAVLSFNKLVDLQGVPAIFTGYSGPTLAIAPLATRKKVLLINAGAQSDKLATASPYLVNTLPTTQDEVAIMSKYLIAHGKKKAAVLYENDAAGIGGRDDFVRLFKKDGGTILAQEPAQFGQTDYRPALLKLSAAKPDVLFVVITAGMVPLADQLAQMKVPYLVAGTSFMADPAAIADPNSTGLIHTQVHIDAPADLASAFHAKFNADMDFFARQYYNAAQITFTVIKKVLDEKKPVTGSNLRTALFQIRHFQGLIPMDFATNTAVVPVDINRMEHGKDVTISANGK
ncbi:MAG: ABC transporter substrate-binding protein [Rhodospirillales bacterium]|nr:ABC transporter substrate-binding protein [Rhodospirillales bacterium]